MVILFNGIVTCLILVSMMLIGVLNYRQTEKKNFNFLRCFPFELQNNPGFHFNFVYRMVMALFSGSVVLFAFNVFVFPLVIKQAYVEAVLIVLTMLFWMATFMVDFRQYRLHFIASSCYMVLQLFDFLFLGYYVLIDPYHIFDISLAVVSFVIGGFLLVILIVPLLSEWWKLERNKEGDTETLRRKKYNLYAISEWIYFIFTEIFIVILTIYSFI